MPTSLTVRPRAVSTMEGIAVTCLVLCLARTGLAQSEALRSLRPDEIQWSQRRQSPDAFYATVCGDPVKAGSSGEVVFQEGGLGPSSHDLVKK